MERGIAGRQRGVFIGIRFPASDFVFPVGQFGRGGFQTRPYMLSCPCTRAPVGPASPRDAGSFIGHRRGGGTGVPPVDGQDARPTEQGIAPSGACHGHGHESPIGNSSQLRVSFLFGPVSVSTIPAANCRQKAMAFACIPGDDSFSLRHSCRLASLLRCLE